VTPAGAAAVAAAAVASSCPSWAIGVGLGAAIGVALSLLLLLLVDRWLSSGSAGALYDQVRPARRDEAPELDRLRAWRDDVRERLQASREAECGPLEDEDALCRQLADLSNRIERLELEGWR
jgi:hypothetical protein